MHCAFTGHFSAAQVAIKKVLQDKRFKNRELQIMKMMGHPNVVDLQHCFFTQEKNEVRAPVTRRLFLALPCLRSRILATPAACCFTDAAASQLAPAAMQLCSREVNRKACSCHKTLYYKKILIVDFYYLTEFLRFGQIVNKYSYFVYAYL